MTRADLRRGARPPYFHIALPPSPHSHPHPPFENSWIRLCVVCVAIYHIL